MSEGVKSVTTPPGFVFARAVYYFIFEFSGKTFQMTVPSWNCGSELLSKSRAGKCITENSFDRTKGEPRLAKSKSAEAQYLTGSESRLSAHELV